MDIQIINNIKTLGIDMINEAKSGHPGIVLGAANIIYTLYSRHLNINPNDPNWINRDRFVMSAGHGSALLYATLYMAGYLKIEDLKQFRKINSITPGHPEYGVTPGVDMSTGPLGQGFASSVGMALASKKLNQEISKKREKFYQNDMSLIDHKVYCLCGDGDLMEGVTSEAASLAGALKLNNLIVLYDSNNICLEGNTSNTFKEDTLLKFKAMGWNTIFVKNDTVKDIDNAIKKAKTSDKPTIIEIKTTIGKDSILQNTNKVHGSPLTDTDIKQLKEKLNIPNNAFYVNQEARQYFQKQINEHSDKAYSKWAENYKKFRNREIINNIEDYEFIFKNNINYNINNINFNIDSDFKEATRTTNPKIMDVIAKNIPNFIGGSADLAHPTGAYLEHFKMITSDDYSGRNITFGVREHAMGSIANGMALYNYKVFTSTFLSFSDYMKPAIRMSSLMHLPVTYIFSHDSINIGQDGPTHQPIEQLASLRSIPGMYVYRPSDIEELIGCWNMIINTNNHPNSLILSRVETPKIPNTNRQLISRGAYLIKKEINKIDGILVATGTDLYVAYNVANNLYRKYNLDLRVVSMPCIEIYEKQPLEYKEALIPKQYKQFVIEAGSSYGLEKIKNDNTIFITIDTFGKSGSKDEVLKDMNFNFISIEDRILNILK